jgi:hypothetical protein
MRLLFRRIPSLKTLQRTTCAKNKPAARRIGIVKAVSYQRKGNLTMKLQHYGKIAILTLGIALTATFAGPSTAQANHRDWDRDDDWRDWDSYHHRRYHSYYYHRHPRGAYYRYYAPRTYVYYRGHRGYWDDRAGVRVFIRLP